MRAVQWLRKPGQFAKVVQDTVRLTRRSQLCQRGWGQGIVGHRVEVVAFGAGRLGNPESEIMAGGSIR